MWQGQERRVFVAPFGKVGFSFTWSESFVSEGPASVMVSCWSQSQTKWKNSIFCPFHRTIKTGRSPVFGKNKQIKKTPTKYQGEKYLLYSSPRNTAFISFLAFVESFSCLFSRRDGNFFHHFYYFYGINWDSRSHKVPYDTCRARIHIAMASVECYQQSERRLPWAKKYYHQTHDNPKHKEESSS